MTRLNNVFSQKKQHEIVLLPKSNFTSPKKKRVRSLPFPSELYCRYCKVTKTPEWRRGPDGFKSLCNACGIHFARILQEERKVEMVDERVTKQKLRIENFLNDTNINNNINNNFNNNNNNFIDIQSVINNGVKNDLKNHQKENSKILY